MKISNLLKISALCCTVLCGVSNNTCNAGKGKHQNNMISKIFGEESNSVHEEFVKQNNTLLECFDNIVISNNKEAVLLYSYQGVMKHYYKIKGKEKRQKHETLLLRQVQRELENANVNSLEDLKRRLPIKNKFYKLNDDILEPLNIEDTLADRTNNFVKENHHLACEINGIFNIDDKVRFTENGNGITYIQAIFPNNREISITNYVNTIFYKNGNVLVYRLQNNENENLYGNYEESDDNSINYNNDEESDDNSLWKEIIDNFVQLNNELSKRENSFNDINKKELIELSVKAAFGDDYTVSKL